MRPRAEFERLLDDQIEDGIAILERASGFEPADSARAEFRTCHEFNCTLLERSFSSNAEQNTYVAAVPVRMASSSEVAKTQHLLQDLKGTIRKLRSLKAQLDLYEIARPGDGTARRLAAADGPIFVVHGHDGEAREAVARFLERLGTNPVILHEQPNRSQTIIEKFERHGGAAGFAVVLLTSDDEGREQGDSELQPRGRQNVVLELGFFMGALGRDHTAILYEPGVELPSDLGGLLYIELDDQGAWRFKLAKELNAAGVSVDLNKAM